MVEKKTSFSPHEVLGAITVGLVSVSMGLVSGFVSEKKTREMTVFGFYTLHS